MSCRARDWAWSRKGLTLAQRVVLLALAEYADENGSRCFPSLGLLERMTELSRRGITKALSGLDGTLIERDRGGTGSSDPLSTADTGARGGQRRRRRSGTKFPKHA